MVDVAVELADEGDVETVVEEGGERIVGGQRLDTQHGAWEPLMQRGHHIGHPLVVGGALRRQTERAPATVGELVQVEASGAQLAQSGLGRVQHPSSGAVGDQPPAASLEQRRAEPLLEPQEALAQCRLADVEVAGGRREGGVLAERIEQFEVTYADVHNKMLEPSSKFFVDVWISHPYV